MQLHGLRGRRPLNGRPDCVWLVGHRSAGGRRLSLRYIGPTPSRSVHDQRLCSCGMRCYAFALLPFVIQLPPGHSKSKFRLARTVGVYRTWKIAINPVQSPDRLELGRGWITVPQRGRPEVGADVSPWTATAEAGAEIEVPPTSLDQIPTASTPDNLLLRLTTTTNYIS